MKKFYSYDNMNIHICPIKRKKKVVMTLPSKLIKVLQNATDEVESKDTEQQFWSGNLPLNMMETSIGIFLSPGSDISDDIERKLRDLYSYLYEITGVELLPSINNVYCMQRYGCIPDEDPFRNLRTSEYINCKDGKEFVLAISFRKSVLFLRESPENETLLHCFQNRWRQLDSKRKAPAVIINFEKEDTILMKDVPLRSFFMFKDTLYLKVSSTYAINLDSGATLAHDLLGTKDSPFSASDYQELEVQFLGSSYIEVF